MWVEHLSLRNFRNYRSMELTLFPGLIVVGGGNAQGKTNLLESIEFLAIMKSFRAPFGRELLNWHAAGAKETATVTGWVRGRQGSTRVHVALQPLTPDPTQQKSDSQLMVKKHIRINGAPESAAHAVGRINAVLFSANDLDLVLGSPNLRRRYLDVLLCQIDPGYVKALQRYQRVLVQRNHLLRRTREGRGMASEEINFWNGELISCGSYIIQCRREVVQALQKLVGRFYAHLSGGEVITAEYSSTIDIPKSEGLAVVEEAFAESLRSEYRREIAQGATVVGPHRDDVTLKLQGMPALSHSSRGQARTMALALRLAEAELLTQKRGEGPILLLDDVLSELDDLRRRQVMEQVELYDQAILTTADEGQLSRELLTRVPRLSVRDGAIEPISIPDELQHDRSLKQ